MFGGVANDGRNAEKTRSLSGTPPTLTGDKLEETVLEGADNDGLHDTVLANGVG